MTPSSLPPAPPRPDRGPVIGLLIFTAMLLAPLLYGLYYLGHDYLTCSGTPDCQRSHDSKVWWARAAFALVGAPFGGAALTGFVGSALKRRASVWAATGALLGTLAAWAGAIASLCIGFQNSNFDF